MDEQKTKREYSNEEATELGIRIKSLRILNRLNQKELAEKAGLSYNTIAAIELGKYNTGVRQLMQILKAMDYELVFQPKARPMI